MRRVISKYQCWNWGPSCVVLWYWTPPVQLDRRFIVYIHFARCMTWSTHLSDTLRLHFGKLRLSFQVGLAPRVCVRSGHGPRPSNCACVPLDKAGMSSTNLYIP